VQFIHFGEDAHKRFLVELPAVIRQNILSQRGLRTRTSVLTIYIAVPVHPKLMKKVTSKL
jgi:hypothetical protein